MAADTRPTDREKGTGKQELRADFDRDASALCRLVFADPPATCGPPDRHSAAGKLTVCGNRGLFDAISWVALSDAVL